MEHSAFIDLSVLSEEAKRELMEFYSHLIKKYKLGNGKKRKLPLQEKNFNALSIDTVGYKFNRDEANER